MLDTQPVETTLYSLDSAAPQADQRRTSERHLSLLRVGSLMIGERRELCLIKNISAGGMLIRVYSRIKEGDRVSVELKQGEAVSGTARWTHDDCVGVSFDEPIDVIGLISHSSEGKRPRMPRVEVSCAAWMREGAQVSRVTAADISQGGVKIITPIDFTVGAQVVMTMIGLTPIAGVVRWRDGDCYGVTFNRPLSLSVLVGWLQEQQQRREPRAVVG